MTRIEGLWEKGRACRELAGEAVGYARLSSSVRCMTGQAFKLSSGWEALRGETVAGET